MLKKFSFIIILIILIFLLKPNILNNNIFIDNKVYEFDNYNKIDKNHFMYLYIPIINLKKEIFEKNSVHNNVDKNVTILKESDFPNENNSKVLLAAHTGNSEVAFFTNLIKLSIGDEIIIEYKNKLYIYNLVKIEEHIKTGYIKTDLNLFQEIFLITCKKNDRNKQLVFIGRLSQIKKQTNVW